MGVGGPIAKDKVWFFFQFRDEGSHRTVPGLFANLNMGDPTKWLYAVDQSRPAVQAGQLAKCGAPLDRAANAAEQVQSSSGTSRFHVRAPAIWVPMTDAGNRATAKSSAERPARPIPHAARRSERQGPEVGTYLSGYGQRVQQATWSSPINNKLLLEAGFGTYLSQWGGIPQPGSPFYNLVGVTEQCTVANCAAFGGIPNLHYRSGTYRQNLQGTFGWRALGVLRHRALRA